MTDLKQISAIVLAAGLSCRMGQNKLLMRVSGKPVLSHTLDLVSGLEFGEKILVISEETAKGLQIPEDFTTKINKNPEQGLASSLKLGLSAATRKYYMFFLADMPMLDKDTVLKIISGISGGKIVVPKAAGIPANPVVFPEKYRDELLKITGDKGGRDIIAANAADCRIVTLENAAALRDIDTPEDYSESTLE